MHENPAGCEHRTGPGAAVVGMRPLRRDAERNRQRVLEAASEVFTERGLDVSLDEVARHAGVGVGTVYRRFGTKEDLVEALFMDRIEEVATLAEEAAEAADPWSGLVCFMEQMTAMLAGDRGLRQMLMFATYGRDKVWYARQRNAPLVTRLVERAQAAGQLRSDLKQTDIPFIVFVLTEVAQCGPTGQPGDLAPVPGPRPRRPAPGARGCHPASRSRAAARGTGDGHAPERPAASLTFLVSREPDRAPHLSIAFASACTKR